MKSTKSEIESEILRRYLEIQSRRLNTASFNVTSREDREIAYSNKN